MVDLKTKVLGVGDVFFTKEHHLVTTELGSCVSVCLWDKDKQFGGVCHYLLPSKGPKGDRPDGYYGDTAIRLLLKKFKESGSHRKDIEAKIVGGGKAESVDGDVGALNAKIAVEELQHFGIAVTGESVGGDRGRKLRFFTGTGVAEISKAKGGNAQSGSRAGTLSSKFGPMGPTNKKFNLMVVDDSKLIRKLMTTIFAKESRLNQLIAVEHPLAAREAMKDVKPDVVILDNQMPHMTGIEFLPELVAEKIPVLMISGLSKADGEVAFQALELGAIDFIEKPEAEKLAEFAPMLQEKVLGVLEAHVGPVSKRVAAVKKVNVGGHNFSLDRIVAIGSSTGGTLALHQLLLSLPANIPPIIITQHIPAGFSKLLADRLNQLCPFNVREACNGDRLEKGTVLIAPGGQQCYLKGKGASVTVVVDDSPPRNRHKPSCDVLFESVASCVGASAIGIILTGMGRDGAQGLLAMREAGSFTFGQDEASSVVYGMPKVADEIGAVVKVASLDEIPRLLVQELQKSKAGSKVPA